MTDPAPVKEDTPLQARFVWWSTPQSYANNTVSVLAVVEVALALWLYWWLIPVWFNTQVHLLASVVIAPLLLLRSKASIEEALDDFESYSDIDKTQVPLFSLHCLLIVAASALSSYFLIGWQAQAGHPLPGLEGWWLFFKAATLGLLALTVSLTILIAVEGRENVRKGKCVAALGAGIIAGAIAVTVIVTGAGAGAGDIAIAITGAVVGYLFGGLPVIEAAGLAIGIFIRVLFIKFRVIARHQRQGWLALPDNWRRLVFAQDLRRPPELLPEQQTRASLSAFNLRSSLSELISPDNVLRLTTLMMMLLLISSWFYRLSLKSTFWFYWPLVFAQRRLQNLDASDKTLVAEHNDTLLGWPLASLALALVVAPFIPWWTELEGLTTEMGVSEELLGLVGQLGDKALLVWPAALVSLLLYVSANILGPRAQNHELRSVHRHSLESLIGLRWFLIWVALLVGGLIFAVEVWPQYAPTTLQSLVRWVETHYFSLFAYPAT